MELSTPKNLLESYTKSDVEQVITLIEKELNDKEAVEALKTETYVEIIINGEPSYAIRKEVALRYEAVGWKRVTHGVSSENEECGGLTSFKFYY